MKDYDDEEYGDEDYDDDLEEDEEYDDEDGEPSSITDRLNSVLGAIENSLKSGGKKIIKRVLSAIGSLLAPAAPLLFIIIIVVVILAQAGLIIGYLMDALGGYWTNIKLTVNQWFGTYGYGEEYRILSDSGYSLDYMTEDEINGLVNVVSIVSLADFADSYRIKESSLKDIFRCTSDAINNDAWRFAVTDHFVWDYDRSIDDRILIDNRELQDLLDVDWRMVYAMCIMDTMTFDEYMSDFYAKEPVYEVTDQTESVSEEVETSDVKEESEEETEEEAEPAFLNVSREKIEAMVEALDSQYIYYKDLPSTIRGRDESKVPAIYKITMPEYTSYLSDDVIKDRWGYTTDTDDVLWPYSIFSSSSLKDSDGRTIQGTELIYKEYPEDDEYNYLSEIYVTFDKEAFIERCEAVCENFDYDWFVTIVESCSGSEVVSKRLKLMQKAAANGGEITVTVYDPESGLGELFLVKKSAMNTIQDEEHYTPAGDRQDDEGTGGTHTGSPYQGDITDMSGDRLGDITTILSDGTIMYGTGQTSSHGAQDYIARTLSQTEIGKLLGQMDEIYNTDYSGRMNGNFRSSQRYRFLERALNCVGNIPYSLAGHADTVRDLKQPGWNTNSLEWEFPDWTDCSGWVVGLLSLEQPQGIPLDVINYSNLPSMHDMYNIASQYGKAKRGFGNGSATLESDTVYPGDLIIITNGYTSFGHIYIFLGKAAEDGYYWVVSESGDGYPDLANYSLSQTQIRADVMNSYGNVLIRKLTAYQIVAWAGAEDDTEYFIISPFLDN